MNLKNTLEILKDWNNQKILNHFIIILNDKRIILDEENDFRGISRALIEKWDEKCTKYIIEKGYNNTHARMCCLGLKVENRGFVYALYDDGYLSKCEVENYIRKYNYI
jgi:hypothetical protein